VLGSPGFSEGLSSPGTAPSSPAPIYGPEEIATLPAYHRANSLMHPDLHFSFPSITEKPGQKNISANFIEEWR
jgi:DNA polymerase-3 subunit delta'